MKKRIDGAWSRRELLGGAAVSAGILGLVLPTGALAGSVAPGVTPGVGPVSNISSLALLRNYQAKRARSFDRTGGNHDFVPETKAGETITLADIKGPGQITHMWIAINPTPESGLYLK